ncbi:MAG: Sua5/YciO/YrdC/YwlC family protein, partial [bacterium]
MVKRVRIELEGFVQGVGFRPFVYRLAQRFGLKGFVKNVTSGVVIEAEGDKKSIDDFLVALEKERPKPSRITRISREFIEPVGDISFSIISSEKRDNIQGDMVPDLATCEDCLREMLDPSDRRYLYPFINCTNCGPRFTIIESLPYDRPSTTMREFTMCNACQAEYDDPLTRRFHAQPNACVICGPSYTLTTDTRVLTNISAIRFICDRISDGEIVAVKGVGGYHLVCDATNSVPLEKLRKAKARPFKPFACMVRDKKTLEKLVQLDEKGWELLSSPAAPIVLLRKTEECDNIISPLVAPGLSHLGVMLPYAPIHHLLFHIGGFDVLVATSANRQDEPITIDNAEAIRTLNGIASYFLT